MLKDKDFYFLDKDNNPSNQIFIQNFNQLFSELENKELSSLGRFGIKSLFKNIAAPFLYLYIVVDSSSLVVVLPDQ